ncbi:MAG: glycosyltransferase family 2 protein [candidate division Zixibacteria bacterium]|nr:glycosyltransferase family 2 protein [candidate division Zixibacteria bacterium]
MSNPLISVIIVLYNSENVLPKAIKSLNKLTYDNLEVILVDNASDRKYEQSDLDCRFSRSYHHLKSNIGFGQGCNFGAEKAKGEYLFFVNPDARPEPESLQILVDVLEQNSKIAAVGPQLLFDNGSLMPSYRFKPDFGRLLFSRNSPLSSFPIFSGFTSRYIAPPLKILSEVEVVPATALLVRKSAFDAVRGFDKRYFMYAEDFDLCVMLGKAGYKVYHQPDAIVYHTWGKGAQADRKSLALEHNRSIFRFYRKHYPSNLIRSSLLYILLLIRKLLIIIGISKPGEIS